MDVEAPKIGGKYKDVPADGGHRHHMPSDSVSPLPKREGPVVRVDPDDHKLTGSYGSSREAKAFRQREKELIDQGRFDEAQQLGIDDLRSKFGDKYDGGINQMLDD